MDTTASSFSTRGNAKRSAEQMIAKGTAPAADYGIERSDDGRFQLLWKTGEMIAESAEADQAQPSEPNPGHMVGSAEGETRAIPDQNASELAAKIARADTGYDAIPPNGPKSFTSGRSEPPPMAPHSASQPDRGNGAVPKAARSKYGIDIEAIAAGRLPEKPPVVTSAANPHYQKHFDRLFDLAKDGRWDAVREYKVTGTNSYSKRVARYREDLLALHAASEAVQ
jgi:hypothetical protein